ncbi:Gfo/Idh/MocA family protein [Raoultella ornithinolytica]|uniref:Gfo/Idh/MocA family protein n=1 Tax=Raoultella ornithinolytica TaxID=54291 RepID=UPI00115AFDE4|nr:Gfo/Idh/MocA family oxidoreductase [Raoultella ornithinolytica]
MNNVSKVKVGIVGLGLVSDSHIKAYLSHPDSEVVAVCDLDEAHAKEVAKKYGVPKYYTSYDEMLKDSDINTIDIITPTFLHAPMSIAAAQAGKNIHCEKPFCRTLEEGLEVCQTAEKYGVTLAVGESYVFMTSIKKARELIDSGAIGKPQQIRQRFGAWVERAGALDDGREVTDEHRGWRMDSSKAGGNGFPWMFDHCVHFFAAAEYLMNDNRIKEVYSLKSDISWMNDASNFQMDESEMNIYQPEAAGDIPIMTWTYEDSACQGVWMRAEALNGKYDPMFGFSCIVIGDKGMIEVLGEGGKGLNWKGKEVHLVLHRKDHETETFRFEEGGDDIWQSEVSYYSQAHINQIHEFVDSLTGAQTLRYSGLDGRRDVRTSMAAICSAKEGVAVKVDEVTDDRFSKV